MSSNGHGPGAGVDAPEQTLRHWAQRLHDEPLQGIAAVRMRLAAARKGSPEGLRMSVDDAIDQLAIEIGALRSLIAELRPASLDELGVEAALRGLASRHAGEGLRIEIDSDLDDLEAGELDAEVESTIFRVAQEALAHATRPQPARRVTIALHREPSSIAMTISDDDGDGNMERPETRARFLRLAKRIEVLDGQLEVVSPTGTGTTLTVRLPVAQGAPAR